MSEAVSNLERWRRARQARVDVAGIHLPPELTPLQRAAEVAPLHPWPELAPPPPRVRAQREPQAQLVPAQLLDGCRRALDHLGDAALPVLGVASSLRGEGRTSVVAGLGLAHTLDHDRSVVLVDLDLERPGLHKFFGVRLEPGVTDLIEFGADPSECLQQIQGNLWLLPAGARPANALHTLSRAARCDAISELAQWADTLVCDLPPLTGAGLGTAAARLCSSTVLVVRAGISPLPQVQESARLLGDAPPVILNGTESAIPRWLRRALGDWP
jgi:Mrp family chromosome partitioning ATPase